MSMLLFVFFIRKHQTDRQNYDINIIIDQSFLGNLINQSFAFYYLSISQTYSFFCCCFLSHRLRVASIIFLVWLTTNHLGKSEDNPKNSSWHQYPAAVVDKPIQLTICRAYWSALGTKSPFERILDNLVATKYGNTT